MNSRLRLRIRPSRRKRPSSNPKFPLIRQASLARCGSGYPLGVVLVATNLFDGERAVNINSANQRQGRFQMRLPCAFGPAPEGRVYETKPSGLNPFYECHAVGVRFRRPVVHGGDVPRRAMRRGARAALRRGGGPRGRGLRRRREEWPGRRRRPGTRRGRARFAA